MPKVYAPTVRAALFFDGTWQDRDDNTNVSTMHQLAAQPGTSATVTQERRYSPGVGVKGSRLERALGGAFARGLDREVIAGYRMLQQLNPAHPGTDTQSLEVFLFGFSRGAYTARALAGMVAKVGLAPMDAPAGKLFRHYKNTDAPGLDQIHDDPGSAGEAQKRLLADSSPALIRFVGVWDTVGAYGVPALSAYLRRLRRQGFRDRILSRRVLSAVHAIAIDEHRWLFPHTAWDSVPEELPGTLPQELESFEEHSGVPFEQSVMQRWFVGSHGNIGGGGSPSVNTLATLPLRWMIDVASAAGLELTDLPDPQSEAHMGTIRQIDGTWVLSRKRPRRRRMARKSPFGEWCRDRSVERRLGDPGAGYAPKNAGFASVPLG